MTANSMKTLYALLALGFVLSGAALVPSAAAFCSDTDGRGWDPSVDVIIAVGASNCVYDGHQGDYAEAFGHQLYPLP